jgi:hypothetical protein
LLGFGASDEFPVSGAIATTRFDQSLVPLASATSPDPKNPPLYLDLPTKDGQPQPDVLAKWTANAPLAFIDQYT